jgi:hypothetical protein
MATRNQDLSQSLRDRGTLFDEFLASNPFGGPLSGFANNTVNQQFAPLSAQFATDFLNNAFGGIGAGTSQGDFSQFLAGAQGGGGFNTQGAGGFNTALDALANNLFGASGTTARTVDDPTSSLGAGLQAVSNAGDTASTRNVIQESQLANVNPMFRAVAAALLAQAFRQFTANQENTTTGTGGTQTSLLEEFLRQRRSGSGNLVF